MMDKSFKHNIKSECGFSLLETLIAVFILSTVSMITLNIMSQFGDANQALSNQINHLEQIEQANTFLRNDFKNTVVRPSRQDEISNIHTLFTSENITSDTSKIRLLRFTRGGSIIANTDTDYSPIETIEYWLDGKTLTRRSFDRPDPTSATPYRDYIILENVNELDIRFYNGNIWLNDWVSIPRAISGTLPRAINIAWSMSDPNSGQSLNYQSYFSVGVLK